MLPSFRRKWPTLMKYAAVGITAVAFTAAPASAQDAKQQQIDALNARLEKLEQANQKLLQMLDQQKTSVVPTSMGTANNSDDVKSVVEKVLKDKDDAKKAADDKKKKEAEEKGHEVGSNLTYGNATWDRGLKFETPDKDFTFKLSGRINFDSVFWNASDAIQKSGSGSVNPNVTGVSPGVGILDDGMFLRRARIEMSGTFYEQFEYQAEFDFETLNVVSFDHMWVGAKDLPWIGTLRVGQMKIPQGLESYSSSKNLMFLERSCLFDAFWNEFGIGVYASNTLLDERVTWHAFVGRGEVLNPASGADFGDGNYNYTGRITALPIYENDGRCLVHVGASYQWRRPETGRTQANPAPGEPLLSSHYTIFRDRPELRDAVGSGTNAEGDSTRFVSTGNIICDSVQTPAVEFLAIQGPLTIQAEASAAYVQNAKYPATTAITSRGNPMFWGAYGEVAYCLTGENRSYDKRFGSVGTIKPYEPFFAVKDEDGCTHRGWGAWELCYRYSYLDLNDSGSNILGGRLTEHTAGVNWWLTPNMRLQANYLHTTRDVIAPATSGSVNALGLRAIVEF